MAQQPADENLVKQLALSHSKRGKVALARGRWEEARVHFTKALELLESPGMKWADVVDHRRTLAVSYTELAELELMLQDLDAAAALYGRAMAHFEKNKGPYNEALLALTLGSLGEVARKAGDVEAAEIHLRRALGLGRDCFESQGNQFFRWVLARVLVESAELQVARGQHEAAEGYYREAQALGRELRQGEPENKRYALVLAHGLRGHEELAQARGDCERADRLRMERCAVVGYFVGKDGADVRFQALACQGSRKKSEGALDSSADGIHGK